MLNVQYLEWGYANQLSVEVGDTLRFYISTSIQSYSIDVIRDDITDAAKIHIGTYTNNKGILQNSNV